MFIYLFVFDKWIEWDFHHSLAICAVFSIFFCFSMFSSMILIHHGRRIGNEAQIFSFRFPIASIKSTLSVEYKNKILSNLNFSIEMVGSPTSTLKSCYFIEIPCHVFHASIPNHTVHISSKFEFN